MNAPDTGSFLLESQLDKRFGKYYQRNEKKLRSFCRSDQPVPGAIRDDSASEHTHTKIPFYWQGRVIGQVSENANISDIYAGVTNMT